MDWVQIGQDLLSALVMAAAKYLIPALMVLVAAWIAVLVQKIKNSRPDVAAMFTAMAPIFVEAAEQAKLSEFITNKLDYAVDLSQKWLKSNGWNLDLSLIKGIIEQAVHEADFPHLNDQAGTA